MRINRICLRNFRQFKNIDINLPRKEGKKDLHIFEGVMGTGKTNILNAIDWCLYNEEPYLSREYHKLPRLNLKTIETANSGQEEKVSVDVWADIDGSYIIFSREEIYCIQEGKPVVKDNNFEVRLEDEKGNSKIFKDDEANSYVERFVPSKIKDFFFFDGERLDKYFKEATGQNIQHAIFQISQVALLDRVGQNLEKIINDLRKEAGKQNPEIEKTRERLENREKDLDNIKEEIRNCEKGKRIGDKNQF